MSVNLSPVGGAGAQFFDNNGNPLNGGKLYTYQAGTTTPAATYTSAAGSTAHTNPIILNAGGRVPDSGEIWLSDNISYKFVLKTSADVLIATWDNITGINSNFVNYTVQEEVITATAGQTVFNLSTITYAPATNSLAVYIDGVNQIVDDSYVETDSNTVTFVSGLHDGALVKFTTAVPATGTATNADVVTYDPPFTGAVPTTVETKLAQTISVKDFGAVGDGVTDDTAAFTACRTATGGRYLIPAGSYVVDASPNVWEDSFVAPYGDTSLIISATTYNISGSFGGGWRSEVISQTYLTWKNSSSGATLARWSDGASASDSHQFYLPLEVFRDSHGFMLRHGTVGGNSDILYQDSTSTDMFYLQSVGDAANCTFSFLYDTTPGVGGGFDSAFQIVNAAGTAVHLTNVAAQDRISRTFVKRSAPTYQWVLTPNATTFTLKSQNTSGVDQATLVDYGQYTVTTVNKRSGTSSALPFTGRIANEFSEGGSITNGSSLTFPLVGAGNSAVGTVDLVMVGSSGGNKFYKVDFKFDGTTLTTAASSLNSGDAAFTVSFSVVSSQVELTIGYTGGFGGSARYAVNVNVATVNP